MNVRYQLQKIQHPALVHNAISIILLCYFQSNLYSFHLHWTILIPSDSVPVARAAAQHPA